MFGFATHQAEPDPAEAARRYGAEMCMHIILQGKRAGTELEDSGQAAAAAVLS